MSFKSTYPETVVSYIEARRQLDLLCDLALQSLSQEAVRDEVLMLLEEYDSREPSCPKEVAADRLIGSLREALKREPNAAVRVERAQCTLCSSEPSPGFYTGCMIQDGAAKQTGWNCDGKGNLTRFPAPAAPDVDDGLTVEQNSVGFVIKAANGNEFFLTNKRAAALLPKLGQGWVHPVAVVPDGYVYIAAGAKGVYTHTDKSDWFYTYTLPQPPGASDD